MRYAIDSSLVALPMHSGDWAAMTAEHAALALSRELDTRGVGASWGSKSVGFP